MTAAFVARQWSCLLQVRASPEFPYLVLWPLPEGKKSPRKCGNTGTNQNRVESFIEERTKRAHGDWLYSKNLNIYLIGRPLRKGIRFTIWIEPAVARGDGASHDRSNSVPQLYPLTRAPLALHGRIELITRTRFG